MQCGGLLRSTPAAILACLALPCGLACGVQARYLASASLVALALLGCARTASAEVPASEVSAAAPAAPAAALFGDRGQLVLSADRLVPLVGYTTESVTASQGDTTTKVTDSGTSVALLIGREPTLGSMHTIPRVAIDFTIAKGLTLGTSFAFAFGLGGDHTEERSSTVAPTTTRETRAPQSTLIGFAPRIGYVLRLGGSFALWPRAGLGFYSVSSKSEETSNLGVVSTTRVTDTLFSLDLDPQLVWLPLPHVLISAGPLVNVPLNGSHETSFSQAGVTKTRSDELSLFHLGISASLGVWFDL